ncbi:hypothetical protein AVEN_166673-1 [Araneus ventricosus]|uniref:Uncharacterized protein n=1 Tax=Araneus ventricosus TaxID=182803 RepID=A0A4Y2BD26_ARAVE|nr:hypothetical protein AVEN_166673-1 [Araneus ventricosus]
MRNFSIVLPGGHDDGSVRQNFEKSAGRGILVVLYMLGVLEEDVRRPDIPPAPLVHDAELAGHAVAVLAQKEPRVVPDAHHESVEPEILSMSVKSNERQKLLR